LINLFKKISVCLFFLVGGYQLLNLYLVHKFASKIVKLPEVFPDLWVNWLKEFEVIVLSESPSALPWVAALALARARILL
jgi:hypothetical protein